MISFATILSHIRGSKLYLLRRREDLTEQGSQSFDVQLARLADFCHLYVRQLWLAFRGDGRRRQ